MYRNGCRNIKNYNIGDSIMRKNKMFRALTAVVLIAIAVTGCGVNNNEENNMEVPNIPDVEYPSKIETPSVQFDSAEEFEAYIDVVSSVSEENGFDPEKEFDDITQEMLDAVPDLETITEEEFASLDTNQFRAFIAKYSPEYRAVYGIESNKQMTDEDWLSLKYLVNYRLFGTLWFDVPLEDDEYVITEDEKQKAINDAKMEVYNVTDEDIDNIILLISEATNDELVSLIKEVFIDQGYEINNLENMTDAEIEIFKEQLLKGLEELKSNNSVTKNIEEESLSE